MVPVNRLFGDTNGFLAKFSLPSGADKVITDVKIFLATLLSCHGGQSNFWNVILAPFPLYGRIRRRFRVPEKFSPLTYRAGWCCWLGHSSHDYSLWPYSKTRFILFVSSDLQSCESCQPFFKRICLRHSTCSCSPSKTCAARSSHTNTHLKDTCAG